MPKTNTKKANSSEDKKTVKKKSSAKKVEKKATKKSGKKKAASSSERKYVLDSVLVINNANTMHGQLTTLIKAKQDIVIDASSVEMVDTSILQLLFAFVKKLHAGNLKVTWISPSSELISRAKILKLSEELGLTDS